MPLRYGSHLQTGHTRSPGLQILWQRLTLAQRPGLRRSAHAWGITVQQLLVSWAGRLLEHHECRPASAVPVALLKRPG